MVEISLESSDLSSDRTSVKARTAAVCFVRGRGEISQGRGWNLRGCGPTR